MKTIEIIGDNYLGKYTSTRIACRGLVIRDNKILFSYAKKANVYMLPGGGLEENETDIMCCIREVAEETGYIVKCDKCELEIVEYYGDNRFINKYFICEITGKTQQKLTKIELFEELEPRWLGIYEALEIFKNTYNYEGAKEENRGMYQREYIALTYLLELNKMIVNK